MEAKIEAALTVLRKAGVSPQLMATVRNELERCASPHPSAYEEVKWEELPVRAVNCLQRYEIRTHGLLQVLTEEELDEFRNLGEKTRDKIIAYLKGKDMRLRYNLESFAKRAETIYGSVDRVPLQHLSATMRLDQDDQTLLRPFVCLGEVRKLSHEEREALLGPSLLKDVCEYCEQLAIPL